MQHFVLKLKIKHILAHKSLKLRHNEHNVVRFNNCKVVPLELKIEAKYVAITVVKQHLFEMTVLIMLTLVPQ